MVNHTTYVKGPPGTGKTETIFNVVLSAYANDKSVLICSNNNHPVNDIYEKMTKSLTRKNPKTLINEHIIFPIIRLGNTNELTNTFLYLKELLAYAQKKAKSALDEDKTNEEKEKVMNGYSELRQLLINYEQRIELLDKIESLKKISSLSTIQRIQSQINNQIELENKKLESLPFIEDSTVAEYVISANDDWKFQNYMYYSSLAHIRKLISPTYKDIKEIINIENVEDGVKQLKNYLRDDKNLKRFLDVFPVVVTTNISAAQLGSSKQHFDLCIMDESGQCNVATSLIPIIRAKDLLLVGDTNQLQPVTVLENEVNPLYHRYSEGQSIRTYRIFAKRR